MPVDPSATASTGQELAETLTAMVDGRLAAADAALVRQFPGDAPDRQPVHTVYVPADRMTDDLAGSWGRAALAAIDEHRTVFAGLTDDERRGKGILPLPGSLGEALDCLEQSGDVLMPEVMRRPYLMHKRAEIAETAAMQPEEMFALYAQAY